MKNQPQEKILVSRQKRLIIQQEIGWGKIVNFLKEKFKVLDIKNGEEEIVLIEEKDET
jgi:hypothetical protein